MTYSSPLLPSPPRAQQWGECVSALWGRQVPCPAPLAPAGSLVAAVAGPTDQAFLAQSGYGPATPRLTPAPLGCITNRTSGHTALQRPAVLPPRAPAPQAPLPPVPPSDPDAEAAAAEGKLLLALDQAARAGHRAKERLAQAPDVAAQTEALASYRDEMRAYLHQAARMALAAHTARVQTPTWPGTGLAAFSLGNLAAAAIGELLLYQDDSDPSEQPTLIDRSSLGLLKRLRDLLRMTPQERYQLYGRCRPEVRARVMRLVIGAVMRNTPEPFIDEPIPHSAFDIWAQMLRWRNRYLVEDVAAGIITPPYERVIAPPPGSNPFTFAPVRPFFGRPWAEALAWLDDAALNVPGAHDVHMEG